MNQPVQQLWTLNLSWKMQTVMLQGLRAPDTHFCPNVKIVSRYLRSVILNNADDTHTFMCRKDKLPEWNALENELNYCSMHFTTHFLYALEIVGYHHPIDEVKKVCADYYYNFVHHMCHFDIETIELAIDLLKGVKTPEVINLIIDLLRESTTTNEAAAKDFKPPKECPSGSGDSYLFNGSGK